MNTLINERYEVNIDDKGNLLGRGGEGKVYIGTDKTLKSDVAVKVVDITDRILSSHKNQNNIQKLQLEFSKIELFDHLNVVGYYDWGVFSRKRRIYFATIMDLADSGSLAAWTFDSDSRNLSDVHSFFIGVLEGIKYIHDKGIIHRDLKPANILIKKAENGRLVPLLTDLLTNIGSEANNVSVTTARFQKTFGTIEYMAPELLGTKDIFVGTMTDFWSFGVILYEFFKGKLPFGTRENGQPPIEIAKQILSKDIKVSGIPAPYNKIIELCLEKDITSRISKADILLEVLKRHKDQNDDGTKENSTEKISFKKLPNAKTKKLNKRRTIILQSFIPLQSMAAESISMAGESVILPSPNDWMKGFTIGGGEGNKNSSIDKNEEQSNRPKVEKSLLDEIQLLKDEIDNLKKEKTEKDNKKAIPLSRDNLIDLIAEDKISDCFQILNQKRNSFSHDNMKAFIVIKGEWSQLKTQELLGFIDYQIVSNSSNKIRHKLLTFIDLIELDNI